MWDFSVGKTVGALVQTAPFILLRMAVYFGITLAYVVATGGGAAIGYGFDSIARDPQGYTFWGGAVGFGAVSGILYFAREYLLYLVQAGHIAVLVEVLEGRAVPHGQTQLAYATNIVKARFVQTNLLFAVDQVIKGVLAVITGTINTIASFIPLPGLQPVINVVNAVLRVSLTYVDEVILAYNIKTQSENPWESSRRALVLYAQNYWTFARNAIWLALFMYAIAFLVFLFVALPVMGLFVYLPGESTFWSVVVAVVFAWAFKAAVLQPFAIAALMQVFFKVTEGQTPDPEWDARLSQLSAKFRTMTEKAATWTPPAAPEPGAGSPRPAA